MVNSARLGYCHRQRNPRALQDSGPSDSPLRMGPFACREGTVRPAWSHVGVRGIPTKSARLLGFTETGTSEWFTMRRGAITGSRIAACVGLSPWMSPFNLFFQLQGLVEESVDNAAVEWGTRLEPVVIQKWADSHPECKVRRRKTVWQNIERPWQIVSPDALIVQPGIGGPRRPAAAVLEAKTSRYPDAWGSAGTEDIPVYYRCQALWMLDTLGLEYCHVPVLFSGSDYREYVVRYDEADVMILRAAAQEMLRRVAENDRPDIDAHGATYELIRSFHPDIENRTVELPPALAEQVVLAQAQMTEAQDTLATVRSTLADVMGTAKVAKFGDRKYADRRSKNGGTPYVQFAGLEPQPVLSDRKASR